MNGYTKGARNEIFALKPAPVQVGVGFACILDKDKCLFLITTLNEYFSTELCDLCRYIFVFALCGVCTLHVCVGGGKCFA